MKILIKGGRVIDPITGFDARCDVALAAGRIVAIKDVPADFVPNKVIDASRCIVGKFPVAQQKLSLAFRAGGRSVADPEDVRVGRSGDDKGRDDRAALRAGRLAWAEVNRHRHRRL